MKVQGRVSHEDGEKLPVEMCTWTSEGDLVSNSSNNHFTVPLPRARLWAVRFNPV
jgi:hypothetical protein